MHKNLDDRPDTGLPDEVRSLLSADDEADETAAWSAFLDSYSRLILYIARKSCSSRDGAMDRYAYALEQLRRDDFARLRGYEADDRARFSTWLAVVVRRLCTDFHRKKYGRYEGVDAGDAGDSDPAPMDAAELARRTRRRLVDLVGEAVDIEALGDHRKDPERSVRLRELRGALVQAVDGLESRDRLLLSMRFADEHSARIIADAMDYPSQFHVYRRLKKVLARLRDDLEGRGIDGPTP
ncbi:MAG: RNA polymerase sigma factor [Gemmatimonadota bacterium]